MNAPPTLDTQGSMPLRDSRFTVPGMRCAGCISKIERGLAKLEGVDAARVNFSAKRVAVRHHERLGEDDLIEAIAAIGFEAQSVADNPMARDDRESAALMRALAVAGFGMMNIMLLSVSVWSGAEGATRDLFHWLSAMIALPVVAYAGRPFFASAAMALRHRRTNMDVPISIGVLLATGLSLYETIAGTGHAYFDSAVMLLFFLLAGRALDARVGRVSVQLPRLLVVLQVHLEPLVDHATLEMRVLDRERRLDATHEVARHPIRARAVDLGITIIEKTIDPRMLEEATDDRTHSHVLGDPRDPWAKSADATDDQIDLYPGVARHIKGLDHFDFSQRVHLRDDVRGLSCARELSLALDLLEQRAVQREGSLQRLLQLEHLAQPRELLEHLVDILAEIIVSRQEPEVCVELGRARMIIACPQMHVALEAAALSPHDEQHLGVGLVTNDSIHHVGARFL